MQIAEQTVATFHYTLTDDQGVIVDSSKGRDPLSYLHGTGHIVKGLEHALTGRRAGDSFKIEVAPEEGYGLYQQDLVTQVPREAFQGVDDVQPGMQFQGHGPQGEFSVTVTQVEGDTIHIDGNHPLAGKALHFAIEIVSVRDATSEELAHGHVHRAGAHHH